MQWKNLTLTAWEVQFIQLPCPTADKKKQWKLYSYACSYLKVQKVTDTNGNNKYDIFDKIDKRYKCASVCAQIIERVSHHLPLGFICVGAAPTSGRAKQQPAATMLRLQEVIDMIECRRQKQDISAKGKKQHY